MSDTTLLGIAVLLSVLNNGVVEYVFGTPFDRIERLKPWKWLQMYISIGTALLIVYAFRFNLVFAAIILVIPEMAESTFAWWVGAVLTAVIIARGSNYIADLPWLKPGAKS